MEKQDGGNLGEVYAGGFREERAIWSSMAQAVVSGVQTKD